MNTLEEHALNTLKEHLKNTFEHTLDYNESLAHGFWKLSCREIFEE